MLNTIRNLNGLRQLVRGVSLHRKFTLAANLTPGKFFAERLEVLLYQFRVEVLLLFVRLKIKGNPHFDNGRFAELHDFTASFPPAAGMAPRRQRALVAASISFHFASMTSSHFAASVTGPAV